MAKANPLLAAFNAGELGPLLEGRADLDQYRRGGAEVLNFLPTVEGPLVRRAGTRHMGELKDVLVPALSSTNRPKTHVRGRKPRSATPAIDAFACNEVRMLISMMAYQLMHIARRAMARATGTGWSLRRLRERVLRAGARLIISARRMTLTLSTAAAGFWAILWPEVTALQWAADP